MKTAKYAFVKSLPVMAGYLVLGMGFGVLLASKGYSVLWAFAMSVSIYSGTMQYVAVDLLSGGATLLSAALLTLMVNARYLFYSISMVGKYKDMGNAKPYLAFSLTDETYSLVCEAELPEGVPYKKYCLLLSLMNQSYWILGSSLGALLGTLVHFNTAGVEFSMTAVFLVVFVEQWRTHKNHLSAIIGVGVTLLCLLIFGAQEFLVPALLGITVLLTVLRRVLDRGQA